jgi:hypothetical protein
MFKFLGPLWSHFSRFINKTPRPGLSSSSPNGGCHVYTNFGRRQQRQWCHLTDSQRKCVDTQVFHKSTYKSNLSTFFGASIHSWPRVGSTVGSGQIRSIYLTWIFSSTTNCLWIGNGQRTALLSTPISSRQSRIKKPTLLQRQPTTPSATLMKFKVIIVLTDVKPNKLTNQRTISTHWTA